ncbi:MAG: hypothetical protein CMQ29_04300 [Gammaproteobacteria bacterium]|nr:hypothetical protein [Gammaproteobacteria bacterium]
MAESPAWGNRVVDLTDEGHNALATNPQILAVKAGSEHIFPKTVHDALRTLLGIDPAGVAVSFPLAASPINYFS